MIHPPPPEREHRGAVAAVVLVAGAVAVRALLYRDLPALVTNDTWDYLQAATHIRDAHDYFSPGLRDVRLPGYPTLLALTMPLTALHSDGIVLLQTAIGVATVAIGWAIGRLVGSRLASLAMLAFLGLSPVALLNEHAVMPEAFGLLLYVAVIASGLASLRPGSGWASAAAFGVLLGLTTVTRANVVAVGAVVAAAMWVVDRDAARDGRPSMAAVRRLRRPAIALGVTLLVVAPWLWRNHVAYGRPALFPSTSSNVLLYKDMHAPLDPSTPVLARVDRALGYGRAPHRIDFEWQARLQATFPSARGEHLARQILREQIVAHPWRHLADVAGSALVLVGFNPTYGNERTALRWWFRTLVHDVGNANRLGTNSDAAAAIPRWRYVPRDGDTRVTRAFARIGGAYLAPGRAIAFVGYVVLLVLWSREPSVQGARRATRLRAVPVLLAAWAGTLGMHAVMLADYDRYATMFDFLAVLIAAIAVDDLVAARRVAPRARGWQPGATALSRATEDRAGDSMPG